MGAHTAVMAACAASRAADAAFNALPEHLERTDPAAFEMAENAHVEAFLHALEQAPTTWADFVELLDIATSGGRSGLEENRAADLLAHAKRLAAAGGRQ